MYNYIYGVLICNSSLRKPCKVLRYSLGLTKSQVYVYKSQFDGSEYLKIRTDIYDLQTDKTNESSKHLFNGEITGSDKEVIESLKKIADILNYRCNCQCSFEVYNNNLELIFEYPQKM